MSTIEDQDFVISVVEKAERFMASEMAKMKQEIQTLKAKQEKDSGKIKTLQIENRRLNEHVEALTCQIESMKKEQPNHTTLKTMVDAFRAGLSLS